MKTGSWGLIAVIFGFAVLGGASLGKMMPLIVNVAQAMSCSLDAAAWFISAVAIAATLVAPVSGFIASRLGDRPLVAWGVGVLILGNLLDVLGAFSYWGLIGSRLVEGVGFCFVLLGATSMMMRATDGARRAAGMALLSTAVPIGVALGQLIGGLAAGPDWYMAFWWHGAALVLLSPGLLLLPAPQKPEKSGGASDLTQLWVTMKDPRPLALCFGLGIITLALFGLGAFYPTFLIRNHGLTASEAAVYALLSFPATVVGSVLVSIFLFRVGNIRNCLTAMLGLMAIFGPLSYLPGVPVLLSAATLFLFYALGGALGAIGAAALPNAVRTDAALPAASSLYMLMLNGSVVLGPPLNFKAFAMAQELGLSVLTLACLLLTWLAWVQLGSLSLSKPSAD